MRGHGLQVAWHHGASLSEPCPFPQSSLGVDGFPEEAELAQSCTPEPRCSAGSAYPLPATKSLKTLEYYFGQYWRYEDRGESLAIPGIQIDDRDLTEACTYTRPYCASLDVRVRAQQGTLLLNRRQGLAIYTSEANALEWSSTEEEANLALKVLLYQTELPALLGKDSTRLNKNSQVEGGREEFIVVSAQDQGFTGFDGIGKCYKGEDHTGLGFGSELSCGLRLNVTIVAVNDAPEILTPPGKLLKAFENQYFTLDMLEISDSDVEEKIISPLARWDWTGRKENEAYVNKVRIKLEVIKGHILLSPTARDIQVTGNGTQLWWQLTRNMVGHDLCRMTSCILQPASCFAAADADPGVGVKYQDVCSLVETIPDLIPFGQSRCDEAQRPGCTCQIDNACSNNGDIFLYLNRSQPRVQEYIDDLFKAVTTKDATCGGLARYGDDKLPMSYGKPCYNDTDCIPPRLRGCTLGVDCYCCANLTRVCSSSLDCFQYGAFSQCGCQNSQPTHEDQRRALVAPCSPDKPCFCCNNMTLTCNTHNDCGASRVGVALSNVSYCGCRPQEGICGPFGQGPIRDASGLPMSYPGDPALTLASGPAALSGGQPCLFVGPQSDRCLPSVLLTEGTANLGIVSQMAMTGSSTIEFFGPMIQAVKALQQSSYLTNNPSYTFYNKRYRTPLQDRDSSFNVLEDDEDVLTLTASDMGNSGGTKRRCMLCQQHCLCRADCSECTDCGRPHRAGCYDRRSFVVSVSAVNDPPVLTGPSEIWAVEGMPFSLYNTDYYEMLGGTMWLRSGADRFEVVADPDPMRIASERACRDGICEMVWLDSRKDEEPTSRTFGETLWKRRKNGVGITDPDSKDYGFDLRKIVVTLQAKHGRLFVNERRLEEFLFNGDLNCDLDTSPEVSFALLPLFVSSPLSCNFQLLCASLRVHVCASVASQTMISHGEKSTT